MGKYRTTGADLLVPPELIATNEIFAQHKNLLECCRLWHNALVPLDRAVIDRVVDEMLETVLTLGILVDERYD